ncbi:SufD family Fe-S cluster assembly protein [bacterium]|nr:SufD family Fe-S cluster assembly protein [bacterium]
MREMQRIMKELNEKAERAKNKPAPFGPDIDLSSFFLPPQREEVDSLEKLDSEFRDRALEVGVDAREEGRAGTYFQADRAPIYKKVQDFYKGQIEIMSTEEALRKYDWLIDYWWKAVPVDADKYTATAQLLQTNGYFIRAFKGQKVKTPVQACLFIAEDKAMQNVHNVVIVEEGAELNILTGCTISPRVKEGIHIGISEFYVKRNATLVFTMIHNWGEEFHVRPRTVTILEEGATFVSNYILLRPVKSLQAYPTAILQGEGARATLNSIVYGSGKSIIDMGSRIIFSAPKTMGESIARSIGADESRLYMRGQLVGKANETKGHLDCRGILLSSKAVIEAIPELIADEAPLSDLSHEAAIGPIAEEAVEYLMTRGLSKEEAISIITRGFLTLQMPGLPKLLEREIDKALRLTSAEAL